MSDSMDDPKEEFWETVAKASGMTEAALIRGRLASDGIPTRIRYEAAGTIYAITIDGLGEVRILVPVSQWERAREILSRPWNEGDLAWEGDPATGDGSPEKSG